MEVELLDFGCGFAQDLCGLISAGVPVTHLAGLDSHDGFWKLGMELFPDSREIAKVTNRGWRYARSILHSIRSA